MRGFVATLLIAGACGIHFCVSFLLTAVLPYDKPWQLCHCRYLWANAAIIAASSQRHLTASIIAMSAIPTYMTKIDPVRKREKTVTGGIEPEGKKRWLILKDERAGL